jgi:hypothetical protein
MSYKNQGQRINMKICLKIGNSGSETLVLLTFCYGEYAIKKSSVFEWRRRFKEGQDDVQDDPRSRQPKPQRTDANVDRVLKLVCSDRRLRVRLIAEEGSRNLFGGKTPNPGLTSGFSTMTVPLCTFEGSWLRNPL